MTEEHIDKLKGYIKDDNRTYRHKCSINDDRRTHRQRERGGVRKQYTFKGGNFEQGRLKGKSNHERSPSK